MNTPQTAIVRVELPDGRWARMHKPTVDQQLGMIDLDESDTPDANIARLRFFRDTFRAATVETSWGGSLGDGDVGDMYDWIGPWMRATEDAAFPPASGTATDTP